MFQTSSAGFTRKRALFLEFIRLYITHSSPFFAAQPGLASGLPIPREVELDAEFRLAPFKRNSHRQEHFLRVATKPRYKDRIAETRCSLIMRHLRMGNSFSTPSAT